MTQSASLVRFSELDEEDCSFVLRELELNAFTAVVSAMRAQGVLNNFNECILESLKTALFIPEEVYQAEMRKAANDDFLTRVASILNPSYDTFTAWEMSARQLDVDRPFFPPPKFFDNKGVTTSSLALANDLLALGSSHNEVIAEQDIATARLLSMPKLPYVPERLRKLLKDSESLSSERILPNENDREEEKVVVPPKVVPKKITKVSAILKRKRKVKTNGVRDVSYEEPSTSYSVPEKPAPVSRILSPHTSPTKETASALLSESQRQNSQNHLDLIPTREAEALGVKEFITKIQAQIEQEARNGLLGDNGKRKRKPRLGTLLKEQYPDCARARPFLFPCRLVDGSKPPRGNPERGTTKRAATPGTSPVMVPPITPPNPNGVLQFTSSVSQGVMNHLPSSSNVLGMSLTPGHKENNSVAIRPAAGTLPLNHVISKPPSVVSPATTPNTGVIKRPRMGSFTDKVSSPIDLTQRAAALRKTYMTPVVNKVKVAVTPPVEVHGQAMPVIPNSKPIYPHTVAVTVNRTQNRTFSTSKDQLRSDPHGHDYVLPKTATIIKKTIIATPGPSPVRALNGVQSLSKAPGQNLAPQTIVREQVVSIVKKASTPPAPSNIPVNLAESKVTPPPTVGSPVQTLAMKKYHAMTSTSSQSQLSAGQFLKKTTPEVTSPPAKRVFYCDPNNPTVATLQPAESLPIKEAPPAGPGPSSVEKPSDGLLPSVSIPVPARISENSDRPDILQQSFGEKIRRTVAAPMLLPLLFATAVALPSGFKTINNGLKGQQLVDFLNQNQGHFKAEFNPMSEEEKKFRVMSISWDALKTAKSQPAPEIATLKDADIPTSFDSRTAWPNCPSISFIRDQAQCGSCWAVASASVISDRTCIASNGANLFTASADDIMSCCTDCGFGCNGGIPLIAMEWWHHTGVVTGGEYHSGEGCKPYPYGYPSYHNETTPQCTSTCQPNYSKSYSEDKHFGGLFYEVPPTVAGIQKEIMTHGPVVACFEEYDDFNYYKTGVYVHTAGDYVGLHCTRVIGWGVENGTPYWLGANSWGRSFGDNGFYKIIRGIDECRYESVMATGRAKA